MNDHLLPPLSRVTGTALPTWRCVLPPDAIAANGPQVFKFSRSAGPVKIREIRLTNPGFTIIEYLAAMKRLHPQVSFATAWWEKPLVLYTICAAAGVIVVGGIWPTVLNLLIGAGYGRTSPDEKPYDLSRFKGGPEPQAVQAQASVESLDVDQLNELEEELRRNLAEQALQGDRPPVSPGPVRQLAGESAPAPLSESRGEPNDYQGEYYPVARKHSDDHPAH